jgi:hypothetical protein
MFLRAAEDALFEYQVQSGYAIKEPNADWTYFEEGDELWGDTLYAESLFLCKEGARAKFQAVDTYNKDGSLKSYADTASMDYVRFNDFLSTTGASPVNASQFIVYTDITYRFGASDFEPGTQALFRTMPGAEQELTGLFADDAGFEYGDLGASGVDSVKRSAAPSASVGSLHGSSPYTSSVETWTNRGEFDAASAALKSV